MFTVTTGQSAPRSASIANAIPTNTKIVADAVRSNLADAQAELARALISKKEISSLRDNVANQQAALAAFSVDSPKAEPTHFMSAGQLAIGVRAGDLALSK